MDTTHDAYAWTDRRARRRAAGRLRLADELLRYVLLSVLLVILIRPIGVIVALVWGLGLVRRLYRGEVEPRLHRRFVRHELRRQGRPGRCEADASPHPRSRSERLAREMGDDPRGSSALDWARTALDELAADEHRGPVEAPPVRMADVVEDVVDAFEERAGRDGIELELEVDAEGAVTGDARRLRAVMLDLVGESIRALSRGANGPARVRIQMGENLAGSEVWIRIRDDRRDAGDGARGVYGSRPVPGIPGATLETQSSPRSGVERILTLHKSPARAHSVHEGNGAA